MFGVKSNLAALHLRARYLADTVPFGLRGYGGYRGQQKNLQKPNQDLLHFSSPFQCECIAAFVDIGENAAYHTRRAMEGVSGKTVRTDVGCSRIDTLSAGPTTWGLFVLLFFFKFLAI